MNSIYDIQQLLKRYGTFIYTGDRLGDLNLMEMEIDELYQMKFIKIQEYQVAKLLLVREKNRIARQKGANNA
ncbi:YqgQ family protein [Oceanobacillus longus]|uniref:YqgQ family protein n=1 Tax=Oceanobacillus longus TaxID=930120 RepID=A0ABV8GT81_9BACI